jgi:hypothetical protein
MKLTEIQDEWGRDAPIDELNLGKEATRVPILHAKYLSILGKSKLQLRKAESSYYSTRSQKYRYYRGEMTVEELGELGWNQYQGNKPLKNEMEEFLQCDPLLIEWQDRVEYHKTVIYTLEQIIRSINSRTWDIKSGIEWSKFTNGMM